MHGAGGGAPQGNRNAWKHGGYSRQSIAFRRCIAELTRAARQLVETIKSQRVSPCRQAQMTLKAIVESIDGLPQPRIRSAGVLEEIGGLRKRGPGVGRGGRIALQRHLG